MSNLFTKDNLSFKYPNDWKVIEDDGIENCLAILDCCSGFSRVMLIKYPQEGLSLDYLKNAIEDIPREDSLNVELSHLTIMGNKETHELIANDLSHKPPLRTHSLATIYDKDAYVLNFFGFGLDNCDEDDFLVMYNSLKFD